MKLLDSYKKKIISIKKLCLEIGKKPRKKKVVMCHGVFDIVHPGHIRHLAHAKSKCDFLVVSITADRYVKKGSLRPHVPEGLRAMNLAVLDFVDFVVIDYNPKPLQNISLIKPDFYAKGFEYSETSKYPATLEELKLLKRIKSQMIFTPGDIVYSSTEILKNSQPSLKFEKLKDLIFQNKTSINKFFNLLDKIKDTKIHVIGDTIIDTFTYGTNIGGQTKTPTLSIKYLSEKSYIGGAAVVARHLRKAGAKVTFTSLIGRDSLGNFVKEQLKKDNINFNPIYETDRITTNKNLIISSNHKLIKLDKVDNSTISNDSVNKISHLIKNIKTDIIIFSDFRHGIFNKLNIDTFAEKIPKNVLKIADSQVASRWGNICEYKNFDLITPNEKEARFSIGSQDSTVGHLATNVLNKSKSKNIILKLSEKGILSLNDEKQYFSIDSLCEKLVDAVGAGDALLAYASLIFYQSRSLFEASFIGNVAAACECEKEGNIPIDIAEIKMKLKEFEKELNF